MPPELGDETVARAFAEIVRTDALLWRPPIIAPRDTIAILGYTFGNRIDGNGNRSPGPVNAAIAHSGQPWTRVRLAYLLHDVMCRFEDRRNELIGDA